MPDAVPTVIAVALGAGRRENEMAAATAMEVKYRRMKTIPKGCEPAPLRCNGRIRAMNCAKKP